MATKICTICKIEKDTNDFYKKDASKNTLRGYCKLCQAAKWQEYYSSNKERHLTQKKQYRKKTKTSIEHIKMRLIEQSKKRAKNSGIMHTISAADIDAPEYCPILGIKLTSNEGGFPLANSYSLDKLEPQKGYVPGNVKVISYRANSIKSDGTFEEHIKIAKYINSEKNLLEKFINALKAFWLLLF